MLATSSRSTAMTKRVGAIRMCATSHSGAYLIIGDSAGVDGVERAFTGLHLEKVARGSRQ